MDLAKVKLGQLAQHGDLLERYNASVRVLGQRSLLKPDVLEAIDHAVELTKHNGDAILNVCFPYTSQDEMTTAIRDTVEEFSRPIVHNPSMLSHHLRRSFSETHIVHNIQASRLPTSPQSPPESSCITSGVPAPGTLNEDTPLSSLPPALKVTRSHSPISSSVAASSDTEDSISSTTTLFPESPFPETEMLPPSALSSRASSQNLKPPHLHSQHSQQYPDPEDITAQTLTEHMFTHNLPPLDLLIRTSGVERLSDFMLWQCHESTDIVFLRCLWPEFDLWTFLPVLVEWQWKQKRKAVGQERTASTIAGDVVSRKLQTKIKAG